MMISYGTKSRLPEQSNSAKEEEDANPPGKEVLGAILDAADIQVGGGRPWDPEVCDSRFYQRVLTERSLGLGESYMDGWWQVEALDQFFYRLLKAGLDVQGPERIRLAKEWLKARFLNPQSPRRSRRVAKQHYGLGNAFYGKMLDRRMQYTCAYWKEAYDLSSAQEAKLDLICRKLHLHENDRVLELGGGWGGFARFAAERYGCHVTVYNISEEQVAYGREYCRNLPVEIRHADYREAEGIYDKVVSIGLCEHVGSSNYIDFLRLKRRCVKEDGLVFLHTIGGNRTKRISDPWIGRYIFHGGQLPSLRQLMSAAEGIFVTEDLHNFGPDYDRTLMAWYDNFEKHWPEFAGDYGERFHRMWEYYLLSCAGAFRARGIHLWQMVFSPRGVEGGYQPAR